MSVVTGQQLLDRIRQRADQVSSGFVTDAELLNLCNVYRRELDDLLIKAFGNDYSATSTTFSATANTENYSLSGLTSGTFYKSLGVDIADTSSPTGWRDIKAYNFHDRNLPTQQSAFTTNLANGDVKYRLYGTSLSLRPVPTGTISMKLWYIPQTTTFSTTADTMDDVNGWSEYIVLSSAIAVKDKEESDTGILQGDRQRMIQRINDMAPQRNAGDPQTIGDVQMQMPPYAILPWR